MRYAEELRSPASYFADIKPVAVEEDQLSLAEELIKRKSAKFSPEKFKDEYEAALREMVEAKVNHAPVPREEDTPKSTKVVNLMDALRRSIQPEEEAPRKKAPARAASAAKSSAASAKKGIALVKPKSRKTA
jgi:DNA end-binding protein Ku